MSDITMCKGRECKIKEACYRYTVPPNPYYQSYFINNVADCIKQDNKEFIANAKANTMQK